MAMLRSLSRIRNILVVLLTPIILLPLPVVIGTQESKCAYIVFLMAVYWVTEALPIAVSSLLPVILTPFIGLGSPKSVASNYLNDTSMLFLGGLIIAAAIEHWNIHKRLALKILLIVGTETRWLLLGLMLPTWLVSMWISNTSTTAMMIPIANAILEQLKTASTSEVENGSAGYENEGIQLDEINVTLTEEEKENNTKKQNGSVKSAGKDTKAELVQQADKEHLQICKMMSICIAHAANVGGIGSLTGTGPNVVFKGQSDMLFAKYSGKSPVTFATWFAFGLPVSALIFVLSWLWLQIFFMRKSFFKCCSSSTESRSTIKAILKKEYESLGPVTFAQAAVMGHFLLLALLWITIDLGEGGGWHNLFPPNTVSDSTPAILLSCSLFIFPSKLRNFSGNEQIPPLLTWKTLEKKIPWGVIVLLGGGFALAFISQVVISLTWGGIVLLGGGFALAFISQEYGLSEWLGTQLMVFGHLKPWIMNMILCIVMAAATEVTSNVAICTLMMPIVAQLAMQLKVNPLYFMFPTAIASSFAFMLPVGTPPNAVVFSYGYLKVIDMVKTGFVMNILSLVVLVIGTETWGAAVFDFHTLPDIFLNKTLTDVTHVVVNSCACLNVTQTT